MECHLRLLMCALAAILTTLSQQAAADDTQMSRILLYASDHANVDEDVMDRAKAAVSTIYRTIAVDAIWEDPANGVLATNPDVPRFFVMLVPPQFARGMAVKASALGAAVTTSKTRGRYIYIFFARVEAVSAGANVDVAQVLGHAMAHEIGHLLLPAGHSATGLMSADWTVHDVHRAGTGLLFTKKQGEKIRARLTERLIGPVGVLQSSSAPGPCE
jgi:hypothetical protein